MSKELFPAKFEIPSCRHFSWDDVRETYLKRLKYASTLDIKPIRRINKHDATCSIVGAGPTVTEFAGKIKEFSTKHLVCAVNGAHSWLLHNGIEPHIQVIFENDVDDIETLLGGPPHKDVTYYICSHCHENLFDQLKDYKKVIWHAELGYQEYHDAVAALFPNQFMISCGYVTFFRTISIAMILGFKDFDLFGIDCSFEGESDHVKGYKTADKEPEINIWGKSKINKELRKFRSNASLAFQAHEFLKFCELHDINVRVHGDSLLNYVCEKES